MAAFGILLVFTFLLSYGTFCLLHFNVISSVLVLFILIHIYWSVLKREIVGSGCKEIQTQETFVDSIALFQLLSTGKNILWTDVTKNFKLIEGIKSSLSHYHWLIYQTYFSLKRKSGVLYKTPVWGITFIPTINLSTNCWSLRRLFVFSRINGFSLLPHGYLAQLMRGIYN